MMFSSFSCFCLIIGLPLLLLNNAIASISNSRAIIIKNANDGNPLDESFKDFPITLSNKICLKRILKHLAAPPDIYHIFPKNESSLERILDTIKGSASFRLARYKIYINMYGDIQNIAELMWEKRLPHTIIIQNSTEFVFKALNCGTKIKVIPLKKKSQLFNFKNSFINCPMKILWSRLVPYVYAANHSFNWRGIFLDFLEPLSHLSKRPLEYNYDDEDYHAGIAYAYSYDSVVQDMNQNAILFIGFVELEALELFDLSPILRENNLLLVIPRPIVTSWSRFTKAISKTSIIYAIVGFSSLAFILFGLIKINSSKNFTSPPSLLKIEFDLFHALLGYGFPTVVKIWNFRIFIVLLLYAFMVIDFFIQGTIVSSLTGSIYGTPFSTLDQFLNSHILLKIPKMLHQGLVFQSKSSSNAKLKFLLDHAEILEDLDVVELLDIQVDKSDFATITPSGLLLLKPNIVEVFNHFIIMDVQMCMAMIKNDYSSPILYEWISRLLEAGFLEKYTKLHMFQINLKYSTLRISKTIVLSLKIFWPTMKILTYGLAVAAIVFMGEIIWFNRFNLPKWLKKFENFIRSV